MIRLRFIQALLLTIALAAGVTAWRDLTVPEPGTFRRLVETPVQNIFGPEARFDWDLSFQDFTEGVQVHDFRVPSSVSGGGTTHEPNGLEAGLVKIRHDPIALAAGRYRPKHMDLVDVRIVTQETEDGVRREFPLDVSGEGHAANRLPDIDVRDVDVVFYARPDSKRLRTGEPLVLRVDELKLRQDAGGRIAVLGTARTKELGQDDTGIVLRGWVEPRSRSRLRTEFELEATWDPLVITDALLDALAEDIAADLRRRHVSSGVFTLVLTHHEDPEKAKEAAIRPKQRWHSDLPERVPDALGIDTIDQATKERLEQLFGRGALEVELEGSVFRLKELGTELAGGRVEAAGKIDTDTGAFRIDFAIKNMRLEDPGVRSALGEEAAKTFDAFAPRGLVNVDGKVTRDAEGNVEWDVDVHLLDVELTFVGTFGEHGKREGFPYTIHHVSGKVKILPDRVLFDNIQGINRKADVTIRGYDGGKARGWTEEGETGDEEKDETQRGTGRILFTEAGANVRLTVVATDVPMDDEVIRAIRGSEFSEMLDEFELTGTVDKIELDFIKDPTIEESVKTEMRLTLLGERFLYKPFPLPLDDVRGVVKMRRPRIGDERGRTYEFDVAGWADGAPIQVSARSDEHLGTGRLTVEADGLPLAGAVSHAVLTSPTTKDDLGEAWRWLAPRGKARVALDVPLSDDPDPMHMIAILQDASIRLNAESEDALEIADLTGRLEVKDKGVHLHGLAGTVGGAPVTMEGSLQGGVEGTWDLRARIENLRLTESLRRSLSALTAEGELLPSGMEFEAGGRMTLAIALRRPPGEESSVAIDFVATDLDTVVRLRDGSSIGFTGKRLAVEGDVLHAQELQADAEGLRIVVPDARVSMGEKSTVTGRFELVMDDYVVSENILTLLPEAVREVIEEWTANRVLRSRSLQVEAPEDGPVTLRGDLTFEVPPGAPVGEGPRGTLDLGPIVIDTRADTTFLHGAIGLRGFSMDVGIEVEDLDGRVEIEHLLLGDAPRGQGRITGLTGRLEGLGVSQLSAPFDWSDDVLRFPSITGKLAGGSLGGRFLLHTADPISYEGDLRVADFDLSLLRKDIAPTGPEFSGTGQMQASFQNRSGDIRDLTAAGTLTIREADLGDLPVVANIFTLFDELMKRECRFTFDRADVRFVLEDEIVRFPRLDLAGPLFVMPGSGELDLAGTIDLKFTPDVIKSMLLPGVMQFPGLGKVLYTILPERLVYALKVSGDLDDPETDLEFLPPLKRGKRRQFAGTGSRKMPPRKLPRWFR